MQRQIIQFWEEKIKPLFAEETLKFMVETPFFSGRYVNLDNAATTSAFRSVEACVKNALITYGSVHRGSGQKSKITTDSYEQAREAVRGFVGASSESYVIFTKNTTEAINHAASLWTSKPGKVLVSDIEHSSNLLPWMKYNEVIQYKTNNDGTVDLAEVEVVFKENSDITLLAITGSSNVTGYKPLIHELAKIAHKHRAKILVDVCQLIQHQKIEMLDDEDTAHIDFIAFSGHKMYAPFGGGALAGPKSFFDQVMPYQIGGGNLHYITRNLEIKRFNTAQAHDPGTPNVMGAIAIASAIKVLESIGYGAIEGYESALVREAYDKLITLERVVLYVPKERLGSVLPFDILGFDHYLTAEILAQEYGIGVRAGSFCAYELMRRMKHISDEQDESIADEVGNGITKNIPGVIRASFGLTNSYEDAERFVSAVAEIAQCGKEHYISRYQKDEITGNWEVKK